MKHYSALSLAVALTAPAMTALAADDYVMADSASIILDNIEIVANRANVKTPVAYTTVKREAIEKINDGRDVPFLLSMTPSLITTSDAGAGMGYTSMRVRGSDGSRINVMANGIPINNPESHNVYWVNMPDLASSLRDIQVQRGVGTSANGAGAFGASVNMITSFPSDDPYGEFSTSYGSYNSYKATLRAGSGLINDHWTAELRLSTLGSDGYIYRAKSRLWSYLGQLGYVNGATRLRLLAFGGKEKTYMAWDYASKEEMEKYGRRYNPCGKYTDSDGNTAYYPDQNDNYIQHHLHLLLNQRLSEGWMLNAALHFTKDDGYYEQYKTSRTLAEYGLAPFEINGEKIKKSDLVRLKKNDNSFGGAVASATYTGDRLQVSAGGALNRFHGNHFGQVAWVRNYVGPIDPLQEYYRNRGRKTDGNLYARATCDITGGLSAFGDIQWRHIDYRIDGANDTYDYNTGAMQRLDIHHRYDFFNPKVGVNWLINDYQRAFASWSVAHREPTRDNFTDGDINMPPRPERMFDYELGYLYESSVFSAGVNLYYMDYKDQLVVTGQISDTGNPMSVNVPHSYRAGIELQGAVRPVNWFEWNINATLSRNRIKNFVEYIYEDEWTNPISIDCGDTPIAFSPDFTLGNAFNFKWRMLDASLVSRYVSSQYMTNARNKEQMLDSYFVSDLHLGATFKKVAGLKELHLGVAVYNLFNEKYESNGYAGSGYYVDNGEKVIYRYSGYAAQAPVNAMATVSVKF